MKRTKISSLMEVVLQILANPSILRLTQDKLDKLPAVASDVAKAMADKQGYGGLRRMHGKKLHTGLIIGCFIINLVLLFPGQMSPDSYTQYQAAITATYSDHHPPIMSVLWRLLDHMLPGSGLLFLLHLLMLYGAAAFFVACDTNVTAQRLALLIPLAPPIVFYSSLLWKDVGFACAYLLALSMICYCMMHRKRPTVPLMAAVLLLLFYGTTVKFQAQMVLPIALLGLSYCFTHFSLTRKTVLLTILLSTATFSSIDLFNSFFVAQNQKSHSWQLVKLYDLAGISIRANQSLFPRFVTDHHRFSCDAVRQKYNYERVDDLTGFPDSPLRIGTTEQERTDLLHAWRHAVFQYPHLYLSHRFAVWWRTVTIKPLEKLDTLDFSQYKGLGWFCTVQQTAHTQQYAALGCTLLLTVLSAVRYASTLLVWLPFLIGYFILGCVMLNKHRAAMPLVILNGIGIMFLIVLFFCSMASAIRYILVIFCMIHASHRFGYVCIHDLIRR